MKKLKKKIIFKKNPVLAFLSSHSVGKRIKRKKKRMNLICFQKLKSLQRKNPLKNLKNPKKKSLRNLKNLRKKLLMNLMKNRLKRKRKKADFYPDFEAAIKRTPKSMRKMNHLRKKSSMNL